MLMHSEPEELNALLEANNYAGLRSRLEHENAVDIAEYIGELEDEKQRLVLFRILPKDISADVFAYSETDIQTSIVQGISNAELRELVDGMFLDDTVDFLEEVPANVVRRVMNASDEETRAGINRFLQYPDYSAGSQMTNEMVELHDRLTVQEAIDYIRNTGVNKETIYDCYCIDDGRRLKGTIPLSSLIFHSPEERIRDIMDERDLHPVHTLDDQEQVAEMVSRYDMLSVPVVDHEDRLVGIITVDDVVDIIQDENTEDLERMALMQPSEDTYLHTGVFAMYKNRILWLSVLMVSATFTGAIIESFESKLALITGLTACIPMLMDTGGNAGNQTSTMIIRGLALGEIQLRQYLRVLWKELRVSLLCGATLAALNFGRMLLLGSRNILMIAVVSLSMCCAVVIAKLVGCTLPIAAKTLRLDPALMAGPMITTIVDAVTLLVYFSLATVFLF